MDSSTKTVRPVHFEDFSGKEFERLVFAYHVRAYQWRELEWYGQSGSDMGRDIWGIRVRIDEKEETVCIQCANYQSFQASKAFRDIDKILTCQAGKPDVFHFICASPISARARDRVKDYANKRGIKVCTIWSGSEFEEHLRSRCESVLARFINGISFPDSSEELKKLTTEPGQFCNVPHPHSPHFVRPESTWKILNDLLNSPRSASPVKSRNSIVLYGLHGVGKTQIVCAAAWENQSRYSALLWVRGDSIEVFRNSFGRLCDLEALDLPEQTELDYEKRLSAARRWLREHADWLLIIDNVDSDEVRSALFEWVLPSFAGTMLITSCLSDWPPTSNRIELGVWDASFGAEYLTKRLNLNLDEKGAAVTICETLGGLPIALEQCAAYLEQTRTPLRDYIVRLSGGVLSELNQNAQGTTNYPASFAVVIKQAVKRLTPSGAFLLKLASFLAPSEQFFRIYETIAAKTWPEHVKIHGIQCPRIDVEANVMELRRWSLLRQYGDEFDVHPLVQIVVRESLSPVDRKLCMRTLGELFFSRFGQVAAPSDSSCWDVWHIVYPHMAAFVEHTRKEGDLRALGYLLNLMGLFLSNQGLNSNAAVLFAEAVAVAKSLDQRNLAAVLNNLGEALTKIGKLSEAKSYLIAAIALIEKYPPLIPHAGSSCWNNLGLCLKALGERDSAETAFRKAVALDISIGLDMDDIGLIHQNNLALLLNNDPRTMEEAEQLLRNVTSKTKDEVKLAVALINLGSLLYQTSRASEAIPLLGKAIDILPKYFPVDHVEVKRAELHLAMAKKIASRE